MSKSIIKTITIISFIFIAVIVFLFRQNRINELRKYEERFFIQQELERRDKETDRLLNQNQELIEVVEIKVKENDSLLFVVDIKEEKIQQAKKRKSHEETKAILYAPDTTIIRILSEHHIRTYNNK